MRAAPFWVICSKNLKFGAQNHFCISGQVALVYNVSPEPFPKPSLGRTPSVPRAAVLKAEDRPPLYSS